MTTSTSSSKRERTPSISSKSTDGVGFNKHNGGSGGNSGNSSSSSIRKRVCKACDRCRMKKSKVRLIFNKAFAQRICLLCQNIAGSYWWVPDCNIVYLLVLLRSVA